VSGRIRTVKPEWLEDELLAAASDEARVLSIALILMADDYGRGRGAIAVIATGAWRYQMERDDGAHAPLILARASRALRELHAIRFVDLYEVDRQRYFAIRNWSKHQKVDKPSRPRIPAPPPAESQENAHPREEVASPPRDSRETVDESSRLTCTSDLRSGPPTTDHDQRSRAVDSTPPEAEAPANEPPPESKRRDRRADTSALGIPAKPAAPQSVSRLRRFADAYAAAYKGATGRVWLAASALDAIERGAPMLAHRSHEEHLAAIVAWLDAQPDDQQTAVLRGAFADEWMRGAGFPLASIAKDPGRFTQPPPRKLPPDKLAGSGKEPAIVAQIRAHDDAMKSARSEAVPPPLDFASMLKGIPS
jgi:hypothetical protein